VRISDASDFHPLLAVTGSRHRRVSEENRTRRDITPKVGDCYSPAVKAWRRIHRNDIAADRNERARDAVSPQHCDDFVGSEALGYSTQIELHSWLAQGDRPLAWVQNQFVATGQSSRGLQSRRIRELAQTPCTTPETCYRTDGDVEGAAASGRNTLGRS
jgi:hypothetical protein